MRLLSVLALVLAVHGEFCNKNRLSTLHQVITVFRHGDRTPDYTFPTDPNSKDTWPMGWGQLTSKGISRSSSYGKWMRDCYGDFIKNYFSSKHTYVRSTDFDRTLASAQAYLAGLFPPQGYQVKTSIAALFSYIFLYFSNGVLTWISPLVLCGNLFPFIRFHKNRILYY